MDIDADKLTRMLAARLAAIVPPGFRVEAADGMLWYSAEEGRFPGQGGDYQLLGHSGTYVRDNFEASDRGAENAAVKVATSALDDLQDYVDEATHDPWPALRGAPPRPHALVSDQMLHLWYGGPDPSEAVALACAPIPLADLR